MAVQDALFDAKGFFLAIVLGNTFNRFNDMVIVKNR